MPVSRPALGVNIQADLKTVERCVRELGIGFCFAPLFHPAMQRVGAVRRSLSFPTIFNLLGPLSNPAGAPFQLLGAGKPHLRPLLASALQLLGSRRSAVVSGDDGLDEVTLATTTHVTLIENDKVTELTWSPEEFGLQRAPLDSMLIDGPEESAAIIRRVFATRNRSSTRYRCTQCGGAFGSLEKWPILQAVQTSQRCCLKRYSQKLIRTTCDNVPCGCLSRPKAFTPQSSASRRKSRKRRFAPRGKRN